MTSEDPQILSEPSKPAPSREDSDIRILKESEWSLLFDSHISRYEQLVEPHTKRRSAHIKDPVSDFLFEYYAFRPSHLKRFSVGLGIMMEGESADHFLDRPEFARAPGGVMLQPSPENVKGKLATFITGTEWILNLLRATQDRKPRFGCFGLHEWAMLYKSTDPRHKNVNLRIDGSVLSSVVEENEIRCTHFDAYRFFTEAATPLNERVLSREDMQGCEQPGCLHANMDVYRWAFKRAPWISSQLTMDAFDLAMQIRTVDMASSPYDLASSGIEPIPVETREGREQFVREQKTFSARASELRSRLIAEYEQLLLALSLIS